MALQNKQAQQIDPNHLETYFQKRMHALGITDTAKYGFEVESLEYHGVKSFYPIFAEAKSGNIQINYPCLHGGGEVIPDSEVLFSRQRIHPDNQKEQDFKYYQPAKSGVHIFHPPAIIEKFANRTKIKTLFVIEGEFKAFSGSLAGLDIVGLGGMHLYKDAEGDLHEDIQQIINKCDVDNIVLVLDADINHLSWNIVDDPHKDLSKRQYSFYNAVVGFREATKGKVKDTYFAHINEIYKDSAKGLDDLLQLNRGKEKKVVQDLLKLSTAATFFTCKNLVTEGSSKIKKYFLIDYDKSVPSAFYDKFEDIIGDNEFNFGGARYQKPAKGSLQLVKHQDSFKYVRVGCDYFKVIKVPNSKGIPEVRRVPWKKGEINQDYVNFKGYKNFLETIEKYDAFCNVPDHTEKYQQVIDNCYNLYYKIDHVPEEGKWPSIEKYLKHVFGEHQLPGSDSTNFDLILDCIQLKYLNPTQQLPIVCLVSKQRKTGKSTFLWLLREIFLENATVLGNQEINSEYNDDWASKSVIGIDEGFIDKKTTLEKIKSQSTNSKIKLRGMYAGRQDVEFFGWFVITSNDETNFIPIDEEEIRFWVNKVPVLPDEDPLLLNKMKEEIPAFLHYLKTRKLVHPLASRMYFDEKLLVTDALKKIKENSRGWFIGELKELLKDKFYETKYHTLYYTVSELFEMLNNNNAAVRFRKSDISKQLDERLGMESKHGRWQHPHDLDPNDTYKARTYEKHSRCFEFKIEDWISEEKIKEELSEYIDFDAIDSGREEAKKKHPKPSF
jgi:hypothetical protein